MENATRAIKTKGIVIRTTSKKNYWTINFPKDDGGRMEQYGNVSTPKLQAFIYHVGQGKSYKQAYKLAGFR